MPLIQRIIGSLAVLALFVPATAQDAEFVDVDLDFELFAEGFTSPVFMTPLPDGSGQFIVLDQIGVAYDLSAEGERVLSADGEGLDARGASASS